MALQLWEPLKESIVAFTGLSPATFFTVLALGLAVYYVVSSLFRSLSAHHQRLSDHHQRPRDYQEQMQPLPPPVQPVEPSEDELKQHDGTDPKNSLSMADKGQIYDVSQRRYAATFFLVSDEILMLIARFRLFPVAVVGYGSDRHCLLRLILHEFVDCNRQSTHVRS
ncbi:hypothetical protein ACJRO7_031015 [Eucalyptus globulus]|uniref:Uncharacterized protein n=1 Tax=Eucalyptus globulus TaxID=34317 RepID=A0ABD3JHH0_EUCGL